MAEVKVRITAQNETQSGFQQMLNDAKKVGVEARKAIAAPLAAAPAAASTGGAMAQAAKQATPPELQELLDTLRRARQLARQPIEVPLDAETAATTSKNLSQTIRGLASDLVNANSAGDVFQAVISRLTTALGGLIAGAAGFAIGKIIAGQIDQATASMEGLNVAAANLNQSLNSLNAPSRSFDELGASVQAVSANIRALQSANDDLQGSFRNRALDAAMRSAGNAASAPFLASTPLAGVGNALNALGLGGGFLQQSQEQTDSNAAAARKSILAAIKQDLRDETDLAKARTDEERQLIKEQQKRAELRLQIEQVGGKEAVAELEKIFALQDSIQKQTEKTGTRKGNVIGEQLGPGNIKGIEEMKREREAAARALGPEFGPGTAEAATGGFRVDAAMFQQQQAEEAARAIMAQQQSAFQGSQGASAFQRIGFATNEFFDTRQKKSDPGEETKKAAKLVADILQVLKKGEPLVLNPTNS